MLQKRRDLGKLFFNTIYVANYFIACHCPRDLPIFTKTFLTFFLAPSILQFYNFLKSFQGILQILC